MKRMKTNEELILEESAVLIEDIVKRFVVSPESEDPNTVSDAKELKEEVADILKEFFASETMREGKCGEVWVKPWLRVEYEDLINLCKEIYDTFGVTVLLCDENFDIGIVERDFEYNTFHVPLLITLDRYGKKHLEVLTEFGGYCNILSFYTKT